MTKYAQGIFTPKNPAKYVGIGNIRYRSGWELTFMMFADNNPKVIKWASESIKIPYRNPLTGKQTIYVPDFFMVYQGKDGQPTAELIEIKPKKQTMISEKTRSARDRAAVAVNHAKWAAAMAWSKRNGIKFRVITEDDIFYSGRR
jgi:hypothetical protein